ncbi:NAD(P)-binding protein [Xylariaceae sp. AK1471]|nr:NAD(P)-binding protein [Xylariaceae sp. AK1471]
MPVIAVAGGTGGLGRTIVEEILATGKHEVKILSRQPNPELQASIGATILAVDYSNVVALAQILEDNSVHTVISALTLFTQSSVPPEVQLVLAADASKTTKRYVASNWSVPITEGDELLITPNAFKVEALRALKQAKDLEYTSFYTGFFLDYWGIPVVKSHMKPAVVVVDIAHAVAAIPGSGNTPVAFTHTRDVAKYVAAALDLEKWELEYNLSADKVTWNEFLILAESVRGTKFNVEYDDREKLEAGQVTELPAQVDADLFGAGDMYRKFLATGYLLMENGKFDINDGKKAEEAFPGIKPKTVKSLLEEAWKKA